MITRARLASVRLVGGGGGGGNGIFDEENEGYLSAFGICAFLLKGKTSCMIQIRRLMERRDKTMTSRAKFRTG
jgi:hypothetical protein